MEMNKNSIEMLLDEMNKDTVKKLITKEDFEQAEREINEKMEQFSLEQRSYFNVCMQSASKAYLTF